MINYIVWSHTGCAHVVNPGRLVAYPCRVTSGCGGKPMRVMQELDRPMANDYLGQALIENVKWLNKVAWSACGLLLTVVLLKLRGQTDFKWYDLEISVRESWILFLLLTIAHVYVGLLVVQSARLIWKEQAVDQRRINTFHVVVNTGSILIRGLIPRVEQRNALFGVSWKMALTDPTTWLSYALAVMLVVAVVPFPLSGAETAEYLLLAGVLLWLNWRVGANWTVAISQMSLPLRGRSFYFDFLEGEVPFGIARVGSSGVNIPISLLVALLAGMAEAALLATYALGGTWAATLAKYGLLFVLFYIAAWNFDLAGYSEKVRLRVRAGIQINENEVDRGLTRLPLRKLAIVPAVVWVWDIGGRVYLWLRHAV